MDELRDKRRQGHIAYFSGDRLVVKSRGNTSGNALQTAAGLREYRQGVSSTPVPSHLRPAAPARNSKADSVTAPAERRSPRRTATVGVKSPDRDTDPTQRNTRSGNNKSTKNK